ncbi:MAG: divergent polysaccharide deacetylase family protein, partial [Thermoanaerobaculia bacterium]|nr:divergent polysaccharide deacetylase family protein [Thermoanaerobaculia bacterium]
ATQPAQRPTSPPPAPASPAAREPTAPAAREPTASPPAAVAPGTRVAIVVDDLGRSLADVERLLRLGVPLTYAVLPFETRTAEVTARLRAAGAEVICHLPLEGRPGANPGPGAILDEHSPRRLARRVREALDAVPGAVGLNNHMGSIVTADREAMAELLEVVAERRLFFLDSRTTADSVAYELARQAGVPTARREIFLDSEREPAAVREQFARLLAVARERGAAIAIGHPHDVTLDALDELVPRAVADGYEFVPVSYLLERDAPPE